MVGAIVLLIVLMSMKIMFLLLIINQVPKALISILLCKVFIFRCLSI